MKLLGSLFDSNEKQVHKIRPVIAEINDLEASLETLDDGQLRQKSENLKNDVRQKSGQEQKSYLDEILPEAFALVREAARRSIKQRHFDVQLIAGIVLHQGKIAEQKTGEGKTLTATAPLYLNSLTGKGCHLITPNDYLSKIGAGWMGAIYNALGISCGAIIHDQSFLYDPDFIDDKALDDRLIHLKQVSRKEAYAADITYGTNNEFGFDYLRDNMVWELKQIVQTNPLGVEGAHHFAIVDEVDFILVDEARTPLIISAPAEESTEKYYQFAKLIQRLTPEEDYTTDEKTKTAALTENGIAKLEQWLGIDNLYEKDFQTLHLIEESLKANTMYKRDVDYVTKDGEIIIVDEFTGRLMFGRRYSEGLHQAIEAKENVTIQKESQTLATVSFQNYFRMYEKLAGMTGTAETEAEEFYKIYKLDVVVIPTNKPMVRKDNSDLVFKNLESKFNAVIEEIAERNKAGQPVLVGTVSIEKNEIMSELLNKRGIKHQLLNAKYHEKEALVLSEAGKKSMVTVATNMAGRGVDIELGGKSPDRDSKEYEAWKKEHDEVVSLGGLYIIGTERHEARRIDNQLRGRAGRQGDPGLSRFFVGLDDELMRLFGGDQIKNIMNTLKIPDDMPIENALVSRSIESAQKRVEGHNFDIRKHLVDYDDVMNKQREIIYRYRRQALEVAENGGGQEETLKYKIQNKIDEQIESVVALNVSDSEIDFEKMMQDFTIIIPLDPASQERILTELRQLNDREAITAKLTDIARTLYESREAQIGENAARGIEKFVTLSTIDNLWQMHLDSIDDLREGIGLRGYGQRDPLVEYKNEAFRLFEDLIAEIDFQIVRRIYKVGAPQKQEQPQRVQLTHPREDISSVRTDVVGEALSPQERVEAAAVKRVTVQNTNDKLGRNDPCWCGSGKKWKKCHYPVMG